MEDELDLIIQNMVSAGESEDNIALVINSYNSEKKKSTPTSTPQKSVSGTPTGSSGGVNPAFKSTIPSPIPDFNSVWKAGKSVEKPKTFRLPNESDEVEMQRRGITPPPSEMLKQTANNTKDLYDLDANGNVIPEKPNKLFAGLKKQDKTKGFYQQGEELVKRNKDVQNGFSEKTTFELDGGKLIPKTTVKDFKTSEGIDKEIENNDLNLDHPYLYYSTFDKENQPKDTFVESNFGENKLADLGINTADFDGFLNKKGYKAEFLDKEANGLFEGKGADLTGGYNIQLAKEIQKQRLLNLYMQDINSRDFAKRKLNQEKVNLGKLGADREQLNTQYTLFDANKVGAFYEKEMPILTQKLKERDVENKKIYDTHKNGDAGFFYGTKQVLNSGWNGFLDRVNQTSSTMLDKIGLDSGADELRLLNEERQVQRPNTRDVGYASGRTTTYDGVDYLVTNDGQIIDKDKKIRVTDLFFKPTYDAIVNKSKSGEEDSVFSFQGSAIQAGGVLGDMIVQVALQRGVGLASGATVKAGSLLSKIPISKSIGSAIIAQSALGYSQGLEQTYKAAIDAGIDEKTAKVLATDAAQRMAGLYAVTAPISPQTKAIEGIFGSEGKELIKKAIAAYTQTGKKGFIETFKQGGKQLSKNAIIFTEEGGKEVFQENIQQGGENYGVNHVTNREAGRELAKETISGDEFVNTSILSFASGGLMTLPGMFSSTDKLKTLQQLSKNPLEFEKNLKELVSKGVFTNDKADVLRKDVKIYSNQSHKIPKNLNKDIAMDVMSNLQDISELELKKKGLDKSFHEELDAEIEVKRANIKAKMNEASKKTQTNEEAPTATNTDNATLPTVPENYNIVDTPVVNNNKKSLEEKSKDFDLFHTGAEGMSIESVSVDPRVTRQGRKGKYGGFYTYDNIKNIIDFVKGNSTTSIYGIKLNDGVEITDYNGSIERLNAEKLQELRDSGIKVIRGKSLVGKTEIIVVDKSAIKNISKINDTKQNSTPEAQPQAEVQKPSEADKVEKTTVLNSDENSTKNDNNPTDNNTLKESPENEKSSQGNPPTNGNIPIGADNVGEVRATEQEIPAKESVPSSVDGGEVKGDAEVSDLDHAKDQITKGVLFWSGDAGAERVNLGIPWADIRKGEADIKRGKPDTVPAKRLIEALKTAKEKGGYEYVQGRGGQNHKQFVTLDEIQRSNNEYELTDAEQKEVDAHEVELAKEYEAYFEALDIQTQNDIYENKEGINGLGEKATPSGESKNDVSNQEKPKTPTTKEKIAERVKLSDAKIDATADAVKAKMKAFAAMFPSADINPEDYHTNGFSMDAIIDMVAKAAKSLAKGGIVTSEHIKEAIDAFNEHFDDKIDPKAVEERISPKEETKTKNSISKDLLSQMIDVPNSGEIGKYMSRENIEESDAEEEFTTNQDYEKLELLDALIYGKSIVEQAKVTYGDNYIDELIKNINTIKNVDSKTLHLISLENDLRQRRKETTDIQEKEFLTEQINRLQPISQKLANTVSRALNLNRLRKLSESGVNPNDKSNSIYTKEELETKHEIAKSFGKDIDELQEQYEENIDNFFNEDDFISEDFELNVPKKRRNNSDVKKDISNTLKEMRKALLDVAKGNSAMSSIPYAQQLAVATPYIVKLTSFVAELGIINGKKAVDYVYKEINKVFPGIKKEDVAEIIKKSNTVSKSNLTDEEIFQKKIDQKIKQTEKALENHRANKPKFALGANSVWSEELSAIKKELSDLRNEKNDERKKARELKQKATDLLIASGYGKEISVTKKEVDADGNTVKVKSTKNILDWKKLAGESGSVANISKAIQKALEGKGFSQQEITDVVAEMKTAIEEIKTSITEKSLTDLQNRNKISKKVNVNSEAKNLSQLYNQGIFDDNMDKYDVALNRVLGFDKFKEKQYQDLKDYSRLLSNLFSNKNIFNDNEFMDEDALKTQVAHINKEINKIVNKAAMGKGLTPRKVVALIMDYSDMALLSKLLSLKQLIENPWSGFTERKYQQIGSSFDKIKLTPELRSYIDKGAWSVFRDISMSGSPDLGDSSFSDIRSRKIDDAIRSVKTKNKTLDRIKNGVAGAISGTVYLNGADAFNKVKIVESVFAKAMIDILSNKSYGRNNTMTVKEATKFVSEALTGESFDKAIVKAKEIIAETNKEAGKEILPFTNANVFRLAMDAVKDNLTTDGVIDKETVKAVFTGSFKAAGSALGHESNNAISELYKSTSQIIDRKIKESIKKKDYVSFTKYVTLNIMKNLTAPFVSGRFNWVVLTAQKSGANLGLSMLVTANKKNQNKIDFSSEEGIKNLSEAVHWKIRHDLTVKRSVVGLSLNVLAITALASTGGDDELDKILENSPTLKKLFKWLGPPLLNLYFASQKGGKQEALDFILDFYSVTGNEDRGSVTSQFNVLLDDNATAKKEAKAWGYLGKTIGKGFDTPLPWRLGKDIKNIKREIAGEEQYMPNYNATSFLSGLFQGGYFESIGMREILSGHKEEKYVPKGEKGSPFMPKIPSMPTPPSPK